ncbi:hypothetical protein SUGI_1514140 [Cryptomeria japonica]|uniref:Uncharacterized protein n=1 Tax=Cryptomeria japonica TaxID=3369 RepID=A0AAD3RRS7_CRYJA|nr:hypothetical protein SUGI_1514140 [Cryptomeria japonica]
MHTRDEGRYENELGISGDDAVGLSGAFCSFPMKSDVMAVIESDLGLEGGSDTILLNIDMGMEFFYVPAI